MALLFKKKSPGSGNACPFEFTLLISSSRMGADRESILIRLSGGLLARAGWQIGDRCLIGYDRGIWTLSRTTDASVGYKVSSGEKKRTKSARVQFRLGRDEQTELGMKRGDRLQANALEANGDRIVVDSRR